MIISLKDVFKLAGISIVTFCAVFVCIFFLNFYIDAQKLADLVTEQTAVLYDAQMATAKFCCAITGGVLALIAVLMTVFYIKLYVVSHAVNLGILKAMGYSEFKLSLRFWVFGLSVFLGAVIGVAAGFIAMPAIYKNLSIEGLPEVEIGFHPLLIIGLIVLPTIIFFAVSCIYAYVALKRPVMSLLRGKTSKNSKNYKVTEKECKRSFLIEMCLSTLKSKKSIAFFLAFSCFCFSAMVQMGASMEDLVKGAMGLMILIIGVVLSVTTMLMSVTSLIKGNAKNIAVMKAFGYNMKEIALCILSGYIPFAFLGFGIGAGYQFGLLSLMINVIFKDVEGVPEYSFNVPVFFITFAAFVVLYAFTVFISAVAMYKVSVKEVMAEN